MKGIGFWFGDFYEIYWHNILAKWVLRVINNTIAIGQFITKSPRGNFYRDIIWYYQEYFNWQTYKLFTLRARETFNFHTAHSWRIQSWLRHNLSIIKRSTPFYQIANNSSAESLLPQNERQYRNEYLAKWG